MWLVIAFLLQNLFWQRNDTHAPTEVQLEQFKHTGRYTSQMSSESMDMIEVQSVRPFGSAINAAQARDILMLTKVTLSQDTWQAFLLPTKNNDQLEFIQLSKLGYPKLPPAERLDQLRETYRLYVDPACQLDFLEGTATAETDHPEPEENNCALPVPFWESYWKV